MALCARRLAQLLFIAGLVKEFSNGRDRRELPGAFSLLVGDLFVEIGVLSK